MGSEDRIERTTIYMSKTNYERVKKERENNNNFSLSSYVNDQLTRYFIGDDYELQVQINNIDKRLDEIKRETDVLLSRKTDLVKRLEEKEVEQKKEQQLYSRFMSNIRGRIRNINELGVAPDYSQICSYLHRSFFPQNHIDTKLVKNIFHMVKTDKMTFEFFKDIKNGELNK